MQIGCFATISAADLKVGIDQTICACVFVCTSLRERALAVAVALAACTACQSESSWSGEIARADRAQFDREVYPVLLMDCAYSQCHGASHRFFQVFGPGRTRLHTADGSDPLPLEMQASFERARSMLISDGSRPFSESPLLLKPLDANAGGTGHGGMDVFGRNVYRSAYDPNYLALLRWAAQSIVATVQPAAAGAGAGGLAPPPIVPLAGSGGPTSVGTTLPETHP